MTTQDANSLEPAARMRRLVDMSHTITVDKNISISRYFNSGRELIKSAAASEASGDLEKAFVLYLRYVTLFIEKLIHHPEYSKADKAEKNLVKTECNKILVHAEELKKKLLEKFTKDYQESSKDANSEQVQKRSINSVQSSRNDCDIDDIDRKFDFSKSSSDNAAESAFDPFNIEELKRSFEVSGSR